MTDDEIVRLGARRAVGREALRRLSRLVEDWQAEEHAKRRLAGRIAIGLALLSAALAAAFFLSHL